MIDRNSSTPMYIQLANILESAVKEGKYKEENKLPSESLLCIKYGVSRVTVRQALHLLEQKGLVYTVQGKGTYVRKTIINQELLKVINFGKILLQKGLEGHTIIDSFHPEAHNAKAREMFDADNSDNSICNLNLVGYSRKTPIVYYQSFFDEKTGMLMYECAKEMESEGKAFSSYDLYEKIGIEIDKISQNIMAVNANKKLSKLLNIPLGKALLLLESKLYGSDGAPLEYKLGYYRSDKYAFAIKREII
jgi:GntR family transcriptional regulator